MIILSDCFKEKIDEGCIKVASILAKKLKAKNTENITISMNRFCAYVDINIEANRFFLSRSMKKSMRSLSNYVLYIPFSSNTLGTILRIFMLRYYHRKKVYALFSLRWDMNFMKRFLLRLTRTKIFVLSKESYEFFSKDFDDVFYIKTGVECSKFMPINYNTKMNLRKKYDVPLDKTIILHIGHMKKGRNIEKLLEISDIFYVVLVLSSVTEKDNEILSKITEKKNIKVIDSYFDKVEELYQMSDIYFFPVEEKQNSIDVPLSVLEACSCNMNILSTRYGELSNFQASKSCIFTDDLSQDNINVLLEQLSLNIDGNNNRENVLMYDWNNSVNVIEKIICQNM